LANEKNYEARLAGEIEDQGGAFERKQQRQYVTQQRNKFLEENFPEERRTLRSVTKIGWTELVWTREFSDKTKIVIHHTAGSQVYDTPALALVGVQDIYKFHTLTRWWWDVGYNFIIDPYGVIYEGRAWGKWVVGAHSDWNNTTSIGIALMWNFDLYEPTDEAWTSLKQLVTNLAITYDINPLEKKNYFYVLAEEPYLWFREDYALVGHQDLKVTWCPWETIYQRLPELRQEVFTALKAFWWTWKGQPIEYIDHDEPYYFTDTFGKVTIPFPWWGKVECESMEDNITITDCTWWRANTLDIFMAHDGYPASGYSSILVRVWQDVYSIGLTLVREKDLELLRQKRQEGDTWFTPTSRESEKLQARIPVTSIASLVGSQVHVLMYELSTAYVEWEMMCTVWCDLVLDDTTLEDIESFRVIQPSIWWLRIFIDGNIHDTTQLHIQQSWFITITNYKKTYGDVPMNVFVGDIRIQKQSFRHLEDWWKEAYVLINSVPFEEYMRGVWEISERQHSEKITLMSLISKSYMLFYLDKSNTHPSIPEDSFYNAIDDPRMFQRYFGAWFRVYGKQWMQALEETTWLYVVYDNYVPVLPYFHCSAGYTRSAKDAFWRQDTPWLQSRLDLAICETNWFQGHWVGLSGDGAEAMAQAWMTYEDILQWYYDGIDIVSLD